MIKSDGDLFYCKVCVVEDVFRNIVKIVYL